MHYGLFGPLFVNSALFGPLFVNYVLFGPLFKVEPPHPKSMVIEVLNGEMLRSALFGPLFLELRAIWSTFL